MEKSAVREDLSGSLRQGDKQVELFWRQMNVLAANNDAVLQNIDDKITRCDDLWRLSIRRCLAT